MAMRLLIANRGEIAARIIRTADRMGVETVAAYADPDRWAPHVRSATMSVRLGPADLAHSYLSPDALLEAAERTGATAVHPGYGFLAERADVARLVLATGLRWIGPSADAIEVMGSKIEARRTATRAGIQIIPGFDESQDDRALERAAVHIGYPVLVKASAGGGGKGIRIAMDARDLPTAIADARAEAMRSFGDDAVIVERYITRPRHIEVQVVGDQHGNVVDLGTRECSVQRRYQKLLEEAPAPNLDAETERGLRSSAVALAKSIGYDSVGTVEFVLDDETGESFFLEMNTRLQVEHTVTEMVTGLDLVEMQIRIANGEVSPFPMHGIPMDGHAFEVRVNAEDPHRGFAPQVGRITCLEVPARVRWDSGVEIGSVVTPHYDSMLGKLVVGGPDRDTARRRLAAALEELLIGGVRTNTGLHAWLLAQEPIVEGRVTTRFLDESTGPPPVDGDSAGIAAVAWLTTRERERASGGAWYRLPRLRLTPHEPRCPVFLEDVDGTVREVSVTGGGGWFRLDDGAELSEARIDAGRLSWSQEGIVRWAPVHVDSAERRVSVGLGGTTSTYSVRSRVRHWSDRTTSSTTARDITSPFPALVVEVHVTVGDTVEAGQLLIVLEAMKILHSLVAAGSGVVAEVTVVPGAQVDSGQILVKFEEAAEADDAEK